MIVWIWRTGDVLHICEEKPTVAGRDDAFAGVRAGDIVSPIDAVSCYPPVDFLRAIDLKPGELRQVKFHEDLWGLAQELPSYNQPVVRGGKRLWTDLQAKLEG